LDNSGRADEGQNDDAREHVLPLTKDILAELDALPQQEGPYLFSLTNGRSATWINTVVKQRLDALMVEELEASLNLSLNHDIRRTFARGCPHCGFPR